jgi:hypothetical protein
MYRRWIVIPSRRLWSAKNKSGTFGREEVFVIDPRHRINSPRLSTAFGIECELPTHIVAE